MYSSSCARYGRAEAWTLASEAARRLQHFYDIYKAANNSSYCYSNGDIDDLPVSAEYTSWGAELPRGHVASPDIVRVEQLTPSNP